APRIRRPHARGARCGAVHFHPPRLGARALHQRAAALLGLLAVRVAPQPRAREEPALRLGDRRTAARHRPEALALSCRRGVRREPSLRGRGERRALLRQSRGREGRTDGLGAGRGRRDRQRRGGAAHHRPRHAPRHRRRHREGRGRLPEMKALLLAAAVAAVVTPPAHAELYRWIDPDTGSVKYSTSPPGDAGVNAAVVPYKAPPTPPPAAVPAAGAAQPGALAGLEARWTDLLNQLSALTPQDLRRAGEGLKQQIEAYGALSAELDRLDPSGSDRRRQQSEAMLERLRKGLAAQPGPQKK